MAEIVLVHGIAQQQISGPALESEWALALAGALELSGHRHHADRVRLAVGQPGRIDMRMAYYADLFLPRGAQGDGEPDWAVEQQTLAEAIALQWLQEAALRAGDYDTRSEAAMELAELQLPASGRGAQGPGAVARSAIGALTRIPFLAHAGMEMASRLVNRALDQVTRYLTDEGIRETVQKRIGALLGEETRVVIGHSLGSVAAYEAVHRLQRPLPLLLTLGSPLGMPTLVEGRLRPPASFPPQARYWVNIADTDDYIATKPDLAQIFDKGRPEGAYFESGVRVHNGNDAHSAARYLGKKEAGVAVGRALQAQP